MKVPNKLKKILFNIFLIVISFSIAIGAFFAYKAYDLDLQRQSLISDARLAFENKEYSKAINLYLRAENELSINYEVKSALGDLYYSKSMYQQAQKYYEELKQAGKINQNQLLHLGDIYLTNNNPSKTIELWSNSNLSDQYKYKLAKLYFDQNNIEKYSELLKQLTSYQEPLIFIQVYETNLDNIITNANKAKTLPQISTEIIDIDLFVKQITDAKSQKNAGKADYSELIQLISFSNIGQCYVLNQRIESLIKKFDSIKAPSYQAVFLRGKCHNQSKNYDKAIEDINFAISYDKTNIEYREELANVYYNQKNTAKIISTYEEILSINTDPKYYYDLGGYLQNIEEFDTALKYYRQGWDTSKDETLKSKLAYEIFYLELFYKESLNICDDGAMLSKINVTNSQSYLIKSTCTLMENNQVLTDNTYQSEKLYIQALGKKDIAIVERSLDQDTTGHITQHYQSIGIKILGQL